MELDWIVLELPHPKIFMTVNGLDAGLPLLGFRGEVIIRMSEKNRIIVEIIVLCLELELSEYRVLYLSFILIFIITIDVLDCLMWSQLE
jgi:hypothetical protein